eukprot:TRINITY_DN6482_c0_g1_i1.p1 TRINITY_DN6482_c0_g1~~TRINITY_DN6482_c0_g1_i1.p1  ORF type:complete len:141 (-),score=21.81 TRINITY_DN6482_c0_g1_i1:52-474(-)
MVNKYKFKAVVNLCWEDVGHDTSYTKNGIEQLRVPTVDHYNPSVEDIEKAVKFIEKYVNRGERVLVHCAAGKGRSAAVAICWLMYRYRDLNPTLAQKQLQLKRSIVRKSLYTQDNILKFYRKLQQQQQNNGSPTATTTNY